MVNITEIIAASMGIALAVATIQTRSSMSPEQNSVPRYLRISTAHWSINTYSPEAKRVFQLIQTEGVAIFKSQPGFINYRLMRVDSTKTIAVAEWESEELGLAGAGKYRSWMQNVGIMDMIQLETQAGEIVVGSQ